MATQINLTSLPTNIGGISLTDAVKGPLSSLYGPSKYDKAIIRYPRDLGSNPARKHSIVFTVREADPAQLSSVIDPIAQGAVSLAEGAVDTAKTAGEQVLGGDIKGAVDTFLEGFVQGANKLQPAANALSNVSIKLNRKDGMTIGLYIPDTMNVSYNPEYDADTSLSDALGRFYFLAQGATSIAEAFRNQGDRTLTNMINKAGNDPFIRELAFKTIGKVAGADLTRLGLNAGGYAMNPQLQVLFRGIGFRSFQFDFVFTPYNKEEAQTIKKIIDTFKYHAAPQIDKNGIFSQGMYMKVPDAFDIKFYYGNEENRNVNRIGECVLENVNIDYAGSGQWSTFNDGSPNQIKMTLQFRETIIIDKNRIIEGY